MLDYNGLAEWTAGPEELFARVSRAVSAGRAAVRVCHHGDIVR